MVCERFLSLPTVGAGFRSCERIGDKGSDPKVCCWICDIPPEGLTPCPQFVHSFFGRRGTRSVLSDAASAKADAYKRGIREGETRASELGTFLAMSAMSPR